MRDGSDSVTGTTAGQALYRLLLHAASQQVFASLHTQPLEDAVTRDLISSQLALPGHPQMLLQLGPATTASPTARRPPDPVQEHPVQPRAQAAERWPVDPPAGPQH